MILRMMGGKKKVARDLLSLAPSHYGEFRDIFCANASFLWDVPADKKRWINDLNPDIVRIHRALKSDDGFINRVQTMRVELNDADKLLRQYWRSKFDLLFGTEEEQTLAFWFLSRVAWGQFIRRDRPNIASFSWRHYRNGIHPVSREMCERAHDILQGVNITKGDYAIPLEAPGDDVWLLIDPPYFVDHHCSPLYEMELSIDQHILLADRLRRCPHKFLMTISWNELTDDLYVQPRDFDIIFRPYRYSGVIRKKQPLRTELIVRNYAA